MWTRLFGLAVGSASLVRADDAAIAPVPTSVSASVLLSNAAVHVVREDFVRAPTPAVRLARVAQLAVQPIESIAGLVIDITAVDYPCSLLFDDDDANSNNNTITSSSSGTTPCGPSALSVD